MQVVSDRETVILRFITLC